MQQKSGRTERELHGSRRFQGIRPLLHAAACSLLLGTCGSMADEADDASIARHRQGTLRVLAKPGAAVEVEQLRHEFWFGATLPNSAFDSRRRSRSGTRPCFSSISTPP